MPINDYPYLHEHANNPEGIERRYYPTPNPPKLHDHANPPQRIIRPSFPFYIGFNARLSLVDAMASIASKQASAQTGFYLTGRYEIIEDQIFCELIPKPE